MRAAQIEYEKDPKNLKSAYNFFELLNKNGKYHTLVRLYYKHDYENYNLRQDYGEKVLQQFEYAKDNVKELCPTVDDEFDSTSKHSSSSLHFYGNLMDMGF